MEVTSLCDCAATSHLNARGERASTDPSWLCYVRKAMESREARDLLIEFAETYQTVQCGDLAEERKSELMASIVHTTRRILSSLLARKPTEDEVSDVLPI